MKFIKCFIVLWGLLALNLSYADVSLPDKDDSLIEQLKSNKIRLIVIRHGESTNTLANRVVSINSPSFLLTSIGMQQTLKLANQLINQNVKAVYCSPLYRTQEVASIFKIILRLKYTQVIVDNRLTLQSFGTYENSLYPVFTSHFQTFEDIFIKAVPGGELGTDVFTRLHKFLLDIAGKHSDATIVIVTHAFNCNHINKCLTGAYGELLTSGDYNIYQFD